eukprot:TRINITY_DN21994_c0_g1_i1.p1 TRINITY_DN21994_c0_g1~~TRINITY_DN21994_c0_g1_i1.p1  ORF type:complete len:219 (+),score=16.21 TRINITY_DN21994_c0_g1_i1:715-1371(+)
MSPRLLARICGSAAAQAAATSRARCIMGPDGAYRTIEPPMMTGLETRHSLAQRSQHEEGGRRRLGRRRAPGYTVGALAGIKSKHEAQSYFMVGGDAVEFLSVRFLGHSRGVIRGGISNIRFEDCVVAKRTPSQCLATNGGGPQLGQPGDAPIYNVTVMRHTSRNTGDDSVAFFRVMSGAVRDSYIADSFARGILLDRCGAGVEVTGNTLVRNPLLRHA